MANLDCIPMGRFRWDELHVAQVDRSAPRGTRGWLASLSRPGRCLRLPRCRVARRPSGAGPALGTERWQRGRPRTGERPVRRGMSRHRAGGPDPQLQGWESAERSRRRPGETRLIASRATAPCREKDGSRIDCRPRCRDGRTQGPYRGRAGTAAVSSSCGPRAAPSATRSSGTRRRTAGRRRSRPAPAATDRNPTAPTRRCERRDCISGIRRSAPEAC